MSSVMGGVKATIFFIITTILVVGMATGLGVGQGVSLHHTTTEANDQSNTTTPCSSDVCTSHACVKLGSQIISYMDESVDPCQDFYQFSCNGYLKDAIIPNDEEVVGTFDIPAHEDVERIRSLMVSGNNMSLSSVQKAITFYKSCVDTDAIAKQSLSSLHQLILDLGGWPLIGIDADTPWSINDIDGYVTEQLYGSTAFFRIQVLPDDQNATQNIIHITRSGLTLNAPFIYKANPTRELIKKVIFNVLQLINSSVPDEQYLNAAQEILDFETELAKILFITLFMNLLNRPNQERKEEAKISNFTHSFIGIPERRNITSFDYLEQIFPDFDWTDHMEFYASEGGFSFSADSPVNLLAQSQYFTDLSSLINRTDSRILQNYAKWQLVFTLLPDLSSDFNHIHNTLQKLQGAVPIKTRYKFCVKKVESTFKHAVARAFHDVYVLPGTVGNLTVLTTELKAALIERISSKNWLDSVTKKTALDKASAIIEQLVYPRRIAVNAFLEGLYSLFEVSSSNGYFLNAVYAMKSTRLEEFHLTVIPNNRSNWLLSEYPPTVDDAAYLPRQNQIYIFEGLLNIPFFKPYWPTFYQFGTMGLGVGHEYTHGFDTTGRHYDEHGNYVNWWTPKSVDEFQKRTACFVEQYSKYSLDAGKVNGNQTLGENIADNGGLATAYLAYKNRIKKTKEVQKKLPGLKYTPDQLFFIGATQLWCKMATPKGQTIQLENIHTPDQLRPQGFLSNSPDFAAAFNCPVGSPMNPRDKCEVW